MEDIFWAVGKTLSVIVARIRNSQYDKVEHTGEARFFY